VAHRVVSALLNLRFADVAYIANATNLGRGLLVAHLSHFIVDHLTLGPRIFYATILLLAPRISHAKVGAVEVVLGDLRVII